MGGYLNIDTLIRNIRRNIRTVQTLAPRALHVKIINKHKAAAAYSSESFAMRTRNYATYSNPMVVYGWRPASIVQLTLDMNRLQRTRALYMELRARAMLTLLISLRDGRSAAVINMNSWVDQNVIKTNATASTAAVTPAHPEHIHQPVVAANNMNNYNRAQAIRVCIP